jgi:anaerobic ribonucleoside-triphosphate reductase
MTDQTKPPVKRIPCEVYSRIVGYLRPVQNWNDGKRQEFKDRQTYTLEKMR